jgi:hypothetical protein
MHGFLQTALPALTCEFVHRNNALRMCGMLAEWHDSEKRRIAYRNSTLAS